MSSKDLKKTGLDLTELRKNDLSRMALTTMRPHGKLWSMDVFAWYNSDPELLTNTILAFPFPVIWMARTSEVTNALTVDPQVAKNIDAILLHSETSDVFNGMTGNVRVVGFQQIPQAFDFVLTQLGEKRILLFTSSGPHQEIDCSNFESFMSNIK
jgi:hypothetical protein